jgi:hypothetical protein
MAQPERDAAGLREAADRRSERATERARRAIRRLDKAGEPVSFQSVAREAGVSRQFLYTQRQAARSSGCAPRTSRRPRRSRRRSAQAMRR